MVLDTNLPASQIKKPTRATHSKEAEKLNGEDQGEAEGEESAFLPPRHPAIRLEPFMVEETQSDGQSEHLEQPE